MKENYDISRQMQIDLMEAYKRVCSTCWSQQEAYERMVREPAPRYYVTPKQACQVISPMLRGDFEMVNMMLPVRRAMYYSLFDEVVRLSEKRDFIGRGLMHIMREAVNRPAPRFFISPSRAKIIRGWLKGGLYDDEGRFRSECQKWYANMRERQQQRIEARKKWMLEKMSREEEAAKQ
jgi:hypothetical protein